MTDGELDNEARHWFALLKLTAVLIVSMFLFSIGSCIRQEMRNVNTCYVETNNGRMYLRYRNGVFIPDSWGPILNNKSEAAESAKNLGCELK